MNQNQHQYTSNIGQFAGGKKTLIDSDLVLQLGHTKSQSTTTLLTITHDGIEYDLNLAGYESNGVWFEWVNDAGYPVGDIFGDISVDPNVEVEKLLALLAEGETPDWGTVMNYFGLDPSFSYSDEQIADYIQQYLSGIAAEEKAATNAETALKLLRSFVTNIEAMKVGESGVGGTGSCEFGHENCGVTMDWPELVALLDEAKVLLQQVDGGAQCSPTA